MDVGADEAVDAGGSFATCASRAASDTTADAATASDALEGAASAATRATADAAAASAVFISMAARLVLNLPSAAAASCSKSPFSLTNKSYGCCIGFVVVSEPFVACRFEHDVTVKDRG